MKKTIALGLGLSLVTLFAVYAQTSKEPPTESVHWTLADIKDFEAKLEGDAATTSANPLFTILNLNDRETVRRTSFGKSGVAEVHKQFTDVFCILTGEAEFLLGGEMDGITSTDPHEIRAASIQGGTTRHAAAGDIIIIPAGIPHQILLKPDTRCSFMVVKIATEE